jgi:hypothetical protein
VSAEQVDFSGGVLNKVNELGGANASKCSESLARPENQKQQEHALCGIGTKLQKTNGTQQKNRCSF